MRAMSSAVAVSPAMIAAGSPGLRCNSEKTKSATTTITGMVARMRRTIYANIWKPHPNPPPQAGEETRRRTGMVTPSTLSPAGGGGMGWGPPGAPSFLLDVPQEDDWRDDDAVQVLAVGGGGDELAGRHVGNVVGIGLDLDVGGELLLRREVGRLEPGVDQLFDLQVGRPAEPCFLAIGAKRQVDRRREEIRGRGPGVENTPATLLDRLLRGAAGDQCAPVVGLQF